MHKVLIVMPTKGRQEATTELLPRLLATAGAPFDLSVVVTHGGPEAAYVRLAAPWASVVEVYPYAGYWSAMRSGCDGREFDLVANLANDVLPGRDWLIRGLDVFDRRFPDGIGMVGWNDGIHYSRGTGHFLISRALLHEYYGDDLWPVCYWHYYGDTEIWHRAISQDRATTALRAVMFHNHPLLSASRDAIYDDSQSRAEVDEATFNARFGISKECAA